MELIFILSSLLASAFAAPTSTGNTKCQLITSNYDNITVLPVPILNEVSDYNGLEYSGFVAAASAKGAHSSPNDLAASMLTNLLYLGQLSLYPFGTITPGPGTKTFDIESFWYAVDIDLHEAFAEVKAGAEIVAYGTYAISGDQTPVKTLAYVPKGVLNAAMMQATGLDDFKGLNSFTIALKTVVGLQGLLTSQSVLTIDDLEHRNCE